MATIRKRGTRQWQAIVKRKGVCISETHLYKEDAEKWARKVEREIDEGSYRQADDSACTTLKTALEKYAREVTPRKKSADRELIRINKWKQQKLAKKILNKVTSFDLATFRDEGRAAGLSDATIRLDLMLISALYTVARKDWGMPTLRNPVADMTLPSGSKKRERRVLSAELSALLEAAPIAMPKSKNIAELIELALETGMRQSEILHLEWQDVFIQDRYIHLDKTKSGDPRDVALSPRAIAVLNSIAGTGEKVETIRRGRLFNITQDGLVRGFKKACVVGRSQAMENSTDVPDGFLVNLTFHDLRHEAASRWAEHLEAHELCKMFGWKTMQMALRYFHPTSQSIADKLSKVGSSNITHY